MASFWAHDEHVINSMDNESFGHVSEQRIAYDAIYPGNPLELPQTAERFWIRFGQIGNHRHTHQASQEDREGRQGQVSNQNTVGLKPMHLSPDTPYPERIAEKRK
jgi:hypothetical protein